MRAQLDRTRSIGVALDGGPKAHGFFTSMCSASDFPAPQHETAGHEGEHNPPRTRSVPSGPSPGDRQAAEPSAQQAGLAQRVRVALAQRGRATPKSRRTKVTRLEDSP